MALAKLTRMRSDVRVISSPPFSISCWYFDFTLTSQRLCGEQVPFELVWFVIAGRFVEQTIKLLAGFAGLHTGHNISVRVPIPQSKSAQLTASPRYLPTHNRGRTIIFGLAHPFRTFCGNFRRHFLRARETQFVVHSGLCFFLRARFRLRLFAGGMALWTGRNCMDGGCAAPLEHRPLAALYYLSNRNTSASGFFRPVTRSVTIRDAISAKVMPLPPNPNAKNARGKAEFGPI